MNNDMISMDAIVTQVKELVASRVDNEIVMMSIEHGNYYSLDPIGSRIWKLIEAPIKIKKLTNLLMEEFEVDSKTCEQDVLNLLNEMYKEKVIKIIQ